MGISNEELVQKAIITTDALAVQGKLNPAQATKFLDYVIDETVLKKNSRVVKFRNESLLIDKIGVGGRVAFPKAEAQDPGLRRGVTTSKITLTPREIIVPFEISELFKRISIEDPAQIEDHIVKMMATAFGNDLEELYISGDKLGAAILEGDYKDGGSSTLYIKDSYLALVDGWLNLATGANVVDAQGANVGLSIFGKLLRALPTKFRRNIRDLRYFLSPDLAQLYVEKLATRVDAVGTRAVAGEMVGPYGIPLVSVPLLPLLPTVTKHINLPSTTAVSLGFAPVSSVVVTISTLDGTPTAKFVEDTDYSVDYAAGTVSRIGGDIGDNDLVKVTFKANPQIILTHMNNFIVAISQDVEILKDFDIYKKTVQYAIHAAVDVQIEELTAASFVKNIGTDI